ncbi:hypothetical protein CVT24_004313 [Panaeolus cyanescens]|uniref:Beta-lactamase-related domain-containing protein n=1 Tax=Panaeolus cyanescens TaxID=181874 RepID=A0A409VA95_9AGAR|nr:hypothetical protein CVT24_004313 [Panaeolus cyanescens]
MLNNPLLPVNMGVSTKQGGILAHSSESKTVSTSWTQRWIALALTALLALKFHQLASPLLQEFDSIQTFPFFSRNECIPPSPNLFALHPPRPNEKLIEKASKETDDWLRKRASQADIDSISVGVVTPAGILFQGGYGVLKANESVREGPTQPVDLDTIYRIASVTKMFTVLETLILREKGWLNWDDPVDKYLPDVQPFAGGWSDLLAGTTDSIADEKPRITLRQLATHLGGIGRDYPPIPYPDWPIQSDQDPQILLQGNYTEIIKSISRYPLVNSPYQYPIYSNTGMDILGLANIAANAQAHPGSDSEPKTHRDLIKRDIFDPLGFTHSFYQMPNSSLRNYVAVPSPSGIGINMTDTVYDDAYEPAGGQYSSMRDLAKLMRMILSPRDKTLLSRSTVREWLRPIHSWGLGQSVGAPWEITPFDDVQVFSKGGNLPGYHSEFSLVPEYSYGVIVLVTGSYADTSNIVNEVLKRFHRSFKSIQEEEIKSKYAGKWYNGDDFIEISVRKGVPYVQKGVIQGENFLDTMSGWMSDSGKGKAGPSALWTTGRVGEFRIATGRPELNNKRGAGCMPYWVSLDVGVHSRGAPVDLLYWRRGLLHYPSSGLVFKRAS